MKNREEKKRKESDLVTKESISAVCALFSLLAFFILCTDEWVFGPQIGGTIHDFLTGILGACAYPLALGALYLSVMSLIGKRLVKNRKLGVCFALTLVFIALIVHTAATFSWETEGYLSQCFGAPSLAENATVTPTGWVGGVIVWALSSATTKTGAIIIFSVAVIFFGYLTYVSWKNRDKSNPKEQMNKVKTESAPAPVEIPLMQPTVSAGQQVQTPTTTMQAPNVAMPTLPQQTEERQESNYVYGDVAVTQRPAFSLFEEKAEGQAQSQQPTANRAFSPFGSVQDMQPTEADGMRASYENSREFLFGASPAENYKKNLIFDPNASVNRRPAVDPTHNPSVVSGGYSSYTEAYQSSVNTGNERPVKVFTDRSDVSTSVYDTNVYTQPAQPVQPAPIAPLQPIEQQPVVPQQPVSYPPIEETSTREEVAFREEQTNGDEGYRRHDYMDLFSPSNPNIFGNDEENRTAARDTFAREDRTELFETRDIRAETLDFGRDEADRDLGRSGIDIFDEEENDPYTLRSDFGESRGGRMEETSRFESAGRMEESSRLEETDRFVGLDNGRLEKDITESRTPVDVKPEPPAPTPVPTPAPQPPKPRVIRPYMRPMLDDFDCRDVEPMQNPEEVEETKQNIIATLEDFKVTGASIASTTFGPTVTRYNVTIPRNISPKKVVALDQPIAISLHSSGVNIYPNYEDGVVSIEVPNKERQFVQLGCMLTGDTFVNAKSSSIMFTMGKDAGNRKVYGDISKMIHLLVAGSSGSGKSVFLGSLIISLIYKYSPEELRLILIDPKKTEFVLYNNLPHLMINEIITDANKAVQSLNWAIGEMNRRYGLFEQMSRSGTYVVNLDQYNAHIEKSERLPKIVIIIDELADLMLAAKKDIEDRIQNLTQKARAAGIHLVVATQRPSTDVITGVIKSNLPTRIAFAVATDVDSRVILDQTGAQKLLGKGDFLYTMQGINTPVRVQSAFISSEDSQKVVNYIKANNEAYYDENATAFINNARGSGSGGDTFGGSDEVEPVYIEALRYVILSNSASISLIQRKCSIGYNKAGKIVEWMEDMGYISSFDGAKARKVLITKEEYESKYGSL